MDLNYFKEVAIEENKKNQEEEKDICPICLEDIELPCTYPYIKCRHKYCFECLHILMEN